MLQSNMDHRCGELIKHNYIMMALIVSSFGRLVLLLMMVWDYPMLFLQVVVIVTVYN